MSRKPGRKRLPLTKKRRNSIAIYFSDGDISLVRTAARGIGVTLSDFARTETLKAARKHVGSVEAVLGAMR